LDMGLAYHMELVLGVELGLRTELELDKGSEQGAESVEATVLGLGTAFEQHMASVLHTESGQGRELAQLEVVVQAKGLEGLADSLQAMEWEAQGDEAWDAG
jgi:hypothetical protein